MIGRRIAVVGSSNIDFIMKMERLPAVGETITDAQFVQTFGGKGANQAVAVGRAGGDCVFINAVGDDPYAETMLSGMEETGVDTRHVLRETGVWSGTALVMIGDGGNNYLSVAPGANYRLTVKEMEKLAHVLDDAELILLQYEIPEETIAWIIDYAVDRRLRTIWNFAPARRFRSGYVEKVDFLIVNESEASHLTGLPVDTPEEAQAAADALRSRGCPRVVITLGEEGSFVLTRDEEILVPAFSVDAVDTTAAGDVYCGAFAVALAEGKSLGSAARFAAAASALSVTRLGAQPSAPSRSEIDRFLENHQGDS
ncbi:MAG: ribokinase [Spirochaetaceae bacterium]